MHIMGCSKRTGKAARRRSRRLHWAASLAAAVAVVPSVVVAEAVAGIEPRPTMRRVFEEMKDLVPLALNEATWSAPENREKILAALDRLDGAASALERHGRGREVGFDELARTLGLDLHDARVRYGQDELEEARFFLTASLQNCVACHTRLPSSVDFEMGQALTEHADVKALPARDRAWLYVMVRRFDDALALWERDFADPNVSAAQLDASGALVDYLNVAIRVRRDVSRARKAIDAFAQRGDVPVYLARRLRTWQPALAQLEKDGLENGSGSDVDRAAALAAEAGRLADGSYGRDALVHDLAAASRLVRFLEGDTARRRASERAPTKDERRQTSRAYYWLGVVEARSLDGFWLDLSERHFEAAVRADPKGPFAERAYARLEESGVLGFGGVSGEHLPPEVEARLDALRELMGIDVGNPSRGPASVD